MSREHRTETTFEQVAEELAAVSRPLLVDMVQEGARRMLVTALQIEVEAYIGEFATARDAGGRVMVVRNGQERERAVATAAGVLAVKAPRIHDRREGERFGSTILPPYNCIVTLGPSPSTTRRVMQWDPAGRMSRPSLAS